MTIFIWFVLGWMAGILLGFDALSLAPGIQVVIAGLIILAGAVNLFVHVRHSIFPIGLTLLLGLTSGLLFQSVRFPDVGQEILTIQAEAEIQQVKLWGKTKVLLAQLTTVSCAEQALPPKQTILLKTDTSGVGGELLSGHLIRFQTQIKRIPGTSGVGLFNEKAYWASYGIRFSSWLRSENIKIVGRNSPHGFVSFLHTAKARVIQLTASLGLNEVNQSVILAMLTGDKSRLTGDQKEVFSRLGIMHLLAVSGLHMGLIYLILTKILVLVGVSEKSTANRLISTLFVWLYGLICGLPPSAARAASMLTVYTLCRCFHRVVPSIYVVFVVAFVHTLIQPTVIFSAGFQLSYLAVAGILIYFRGLSHLIQTSHTICRKIIDMASISVSAQAFTWPVSVSLFGQFPVWFLVSNVLLVPVGIFIFYLGLLLVSVRVFVPLPALIEWGMNALMDGWISVGTFISTLPPGIIRFERFPFVGVVSYALLLLLLRKGIHSAIFKPGPILIVFILWSLYGFFGNFVPNLRV